MDPNNEKLQFAVQNDLKIKIKMKSAKPELLDSFSNFLNDPQNANLLGKVEALEIYEIFSENKKLIGELFEKCPNISSLSCEQIIGSLTIPASKLTSFSCRFITRARIEFQELNELTDFYCQDTTPVSSLVFPRRLPKLERLTFAYRTPFTMLLPQIENLPSLKSVSFDEENVEEPVLSE